LKTIITYEKLKDSTEENKTYHRNELLVRKNEDAILAVYCEHNLKAGENEELNLANKITALYRQNVVLNTYNAHVPIFLLDPYEGTIPFTEEKISIVLNKIKNNEINDITYTFLYERVKKFVKEIISYNGNEKIPLFLKNQLAEGNDEFIEELKKSPPIQPINNFITRNPDNLVNAAPRPSNPYRNLIPQLNPI
jgi:hypothetical protein